ncbi:hypothetical protein JCM16303_003094 [Sporobolomyces ruberrimus]
MQGSKDSLAVLLLNAEGDKFKRSYLTQGAQGGKIVAERVCKLAKDKLDSEKEGTRLIVYFVSTIEDNAIGSGQTRAFLRGFASTGHSCFVVEPLVANGSPSSSGRILQLLKLYVPLKSVSTILLGSLHNTQLYGYLRNLPPHQQMKITLVSTITVAPPFRVLVDSATFEAWRGLEALFGSSTAVVAVPDPKPLAITNGVNEHPFEDNQEETEVDKKPETKANGVTPERRSSSSGEAASSDSQGSMWESPFESDSEDEDAWEIAGPRSKRKTSGLVLPRNGSVSMSASSSAPGNSPSSSLASPRRWENENGSPLYARKGARPLSKTSGASRRRKQRERVRRDHRVRDRFATGSTTTTNGSPISPLPAWNPPRLTFSEPHPCINFYLNEEGCHAVDCIYSHSYEFASREEEKELYPSFIKSMICVKFLQGACKKGEKCVKGHRCPYSIESCRYGQKCYYLTQGLPHSSPVV